MASNVGVLQGLGKRKKRKQSSPRVKEAKKVVNRVVSALRKKAFQQEVGIETTEVFKGGSLGHGTSVPGHYDIDLVLYSRSIDRARAAENGNYTDILEKIDDYLSEKLGDEYNHEGFTDVALKFGYILPNGNTLDVDLLLSPYWREGELLSFLQTIHPPVRRLMFSAGASKLQTDFIRHQPQRVKELIRRMKAWRNVKWEGSKDSRPKSFLISLLVITAYNRVGGEYQNTFKHLASRTTQEVQKLVKQASEDRTLDLTIPGSDPVKLSYRDLLPDPPRIIDPANPANNVYLSGIGKSSYGPGDGRWSAFAQEIGTLNLAITAQVIMKHR